LVAAHGAMWVAASTGLGEIRDGRVRRVLTQRDGIPLPTLAVAADAQGRIWVADRQHVVRQDKDGQFRSVLVGSNIMNMAAAGSTMLIDQRHSELLVAADGTVARHVRPADFLSAGSQTLVRRAADGAIWHNKLDQLERNGQVVFTASCGIIDFTFAADGSVWLATNCGLYALRPRHIHPILKSGEPSLGPAYSLAQAADGAVWVSVINRGVARVSPQGRLTWLRSKTDPLGAGMYVVSNSAAGEIWAGSCRVTQAGVCTTPSDWPTALGRDSYVRAIHRARDGSLWVGGAGLWQRSAAGQWRDFSQAADLDRDARVDKVRVILEAADGTLWFGTYGVGVLRRDAAGHFRRFTRADGLASDSIRALRLDGQGQLWIATQDRGLCRMQNPQSVKPRIACIDSAQGLWSNSLHQVLFDDQGRMWLNSNNGIFAMSVAAVDAVLDGHAERVYPQVFTEKDGLPDREGNGGVDNAGIRLADGRMAFPTQKGVAIFNPRDLPPAQARVHAVFEGLTLPDGRKLATAAAMTLARGIRSFILHYTGLSPSLTAPVYFRYRVLPDSNWIDVGDVHEISLNHLSPGARTIELVALGSDGKTGPPARISLDLPKYFYETTTFRLALPLLLLLSVLAWVVHLHRRAGTRQRLLERRVDERTGELREALQTVNLQRDQIEHHAASKTRFFANVSHELRTPLALLVGPIEDYVRGHAPSPQLLGAMQRNAHRLQRLIGQLLDLERIDAQHFPLHVQTLDLTALAQEGVIAFKPLAEHEGVELTWRLPAQRVPVRGDDEQLMRVLGNLLSNALKFCPQGGQVRVTLTRDSEQSIRLQVDDSGPGVAAQWRTRIFDRFSQMGGEATRHREGAGLGLALCREVAELHGGTLYATDSELGGACFVLELPSPTRSPLNESAEDAAQSVTSTRADVPAVNASAVLNAESVPADSVEVPIGDDPHAEARPLVLLAEDNRDLRHYLASVLAQNYRVATAPDGEAALQQARREAPDLIVTDLMMPKLDGLGLARAIRSDSELAGVPIVFLTARGSDADRVAGLQGGADYYLTKPFDSHVLLAQVAAALRACQRLRERFAQQLESAAVPTVVPKTGLAAQLDVLFEAHAHDPEFGVTAMADAVHLSESVLRRHCRDACAASPSDLLRQHRLERAQHLLADGAGNVSEVAYAVGYTSLSAFGRAYRNAYGHPPTQAQMPH
ncbi:MAG: response regulator, partial [Xanthomonadales bacterium]|nr:response regulator [Xanthomonadales bacterium]